MKKPSLYVMMFSIGNMMPMWLASMQQTLISASAYSTSLMPIIYAYNLQDNFYNITNNLLEAVVRQDVSRITSVFNKWPAKAIPAVVNAVYTCDQLTTQSKTIDVKNACILYVARTNTAEVTPLSLAISIGNKQIINILCSHYGASPLVFFESNNYTPLHIAVRCSTALIAPLIQLGACVQCIEQKNSPLFTAITYNKSTAVKALIEAGANLEVTESEIALTPLHHACLMAQYDNVRLLLDAHAFIDPRNKLKETPLVTTAKTNNAHLVPLLLDCGADIFVTNAAKQTIIEQLDAQHSFFPLYCALLCAGAPYPTTHIHQIVIQNNLVHSLLHESPLYQSLYRALLCNNTEQATKLINTAIPCSQLNKPAYDQVMQGYTPLHLAVIRNNKVLVDYLLSLEGINVDVKDIKGRTPLMWAARLGNLSLYYALRKAGAKRLMRDKEGKIALNYAVNYRNLELLEYMLVAERPNILHCISFNQLPSTNNVP